MIWRCPGCGAGFPSMQEYEKHARDCTPLYRGESHRDRRAKKAEVKGH